MLVGVISWAREGLEPVENKKDDPVSSLHAVIHVNRHDYKPHLILSVLRYNKKKNLSFLVLANQSKGFAIFFSLFYISVK